MSVPDVENGGQKIRDQTYRTEGVDNDSSVVDKLRSQEVISISDDALQLLESFTAKQLGTTVDDGCKLAGILALARKDLVTFRMGSGQEAEEEDSEKREELGEAHLG